MNTVRKWGLSIALAVLSIAGFPAWAATPQFVATWTAPTTNEDGTAITGAITYQMYVGASGKEIKFGNPVTSPPYTILPTPAPGTTTCVEVTAIANGVESALPAEACATMPYPKPGAPTVITITIK